MPPKAVREQNQLETPFDRKLRKPEEVFRRVDEQVQNQERDDQSAENEEDTMADPIPKAKEDEDGRKARLEKAREHLASAVETVRRGNNGIQYIMTAFFSNDWEPPQSTVFLAEDHSTSPPTNLVPGGGGERIKQFAEKIAMEAYKEMQNGSHGRNSAEVCSDIPAAYSSLLLYRWRCEPNRTFIFLAGGVGPDIKAKQFGNFSQTELDPAKAQLPKAVAKYAEAYSEFYNPS